MLNLDRSTWHRVKFGDVITSVTSRVDDPSTAGVERYVGLEHLDPGSMTVNRWGSPGDVAATKLLFEPGDVIFGRRRAYQKKVARADFKGICSAHAMVLRAKSEHIDPGFLPVFLSSDEFLDRAVSISVGSLSPTVNWKSLAVQEFDLPPLDQQRRIAELMWAVEADIASGGILAQRASSVSSIAIAEALSGEQRVSLNSLTEAVVDCEHKTAPSGQSAYGWVVGTPDIRLGLINLGTARCVDRETFEAWTRRATPREGDLIFAREAPVGEVGLVPPGVRVCLGQRTVLVRPKRLDQAKLLHAVIRSETVQREIAVNSVGSTVPHLNVKDVRTMSLPWPRDESTASRILEIVARGSKSVSEAELLVESGRALFERLLRGVFQGVAP